MTDLILAAESEPRIGLFSRLEPLAALPAASSPQGKSAATTGTQLTPELIARAQAGDHYAFEAVFNAYQNAIYNFVYRVMGDPQDAYDLTQNTFLKAYLALPKTSADLKVSAWLYRIATNVCLDVLRHRKLVRWERWETFLSVFHPTQVARENPEGDVLSLETSADIDLVLARLHPTGRMCLVLREYHDLSYDEIAEVLNTTRAAVKSLLFRAREDFRRIVARDPELGERFGNRQDARVMRGGKPPAELPDFIPPWPADQPVPSVAALAAWRVRLGLTRETAARAMGRSEGWIRAIEKKGAAEHTRRSYAAGLAHIEAQRERAGVPA
jgi:RNA polymerase sigma-70 factor, ECF subfamily